VAGTGASVSSVPPGRPRPDSWAVTVPERSYPAGWSPGGAQAWPRKRPRRASSLVMPHFAAADRQDSTIENEQAGEAAVVLPPSAATRGTYRARHESAQTLPACLHVGPLRCRCLWLRHGYP
jgi:hypothetical protein